MQKIINMVDYKGRKIGTPKHVLEEVARDAGNINGIIILAKNKDGYLEINHSEQNLFQVIGLLETAKTFVALQIGEI